jgi:iron-sulfur cluster repair protein YtfE (RIC family)
LIVVKAAAAILVDDVHPVYRSTPMASLLGHLAADHSDCDKSFAEAEQAAAAGDWKGAQAAFSRFAGRMARHFAMEEEVLFPAFEARTGNNQGPTRVMRLEHAEMRELIDALREAIERCDAPGFAGNAETLLVLMQQHNLKEEQILYPMCDRLLARESDALLARMETIAG